MPEVGTQPSKPEVGTQSMIPEVGTQSMIPEVGAQPSKPEVGTQSMIPEVGTHPDNTEIFSKYLNNIVWIFMQTLDQYWSNIEPMLKVYTRFPFGINTVPIL